MHLSTCLLLFSISCQRNSTFYSPSSAFQQTRAMRECLASCIRDFQQDGWLLYKKGTDQNTHNGEEDKKHTELREIN